jgi:hypothetical protein
MRQVERSVAEAVARFDEGVPGVDTAHAVGSETSTLLERGDRGRCGRPVVSRLVASGAETEGPEPALHVVDGVAFGALPEGETSYRNAAISSSS